VSSVTLVTDRKFREGLLRNNAHNIKKYYLLTRDEREEIA